MTINTKISKDELLKLAQASKINIKDSDVPGLTKEIEAVLTYASRLQDVKIKDNLKELPHNINIWRTDAIIRTNSTALLALAPQIEDNYFVVPVIIKTSSTNNN